MKHFHVIFQFLFFIFSSNFSFPQSGMLDNSFGVNGFTLTDFPRISNIATCAGLQSNGKIVVAGNVGYDDVHSHFDIGVVRYLTNGKVDSTFGTNGRIISVIDDNARASDLKILSDDKILVAASIYEGDEDGFGVERFGLLRFTPGGIPDSSFGINGIVKTTFPNEENAYVTVLALQSDNKIILAGTCDSQFAIARYFPNGSIDSTFGNNGIVLNIFSAEDLLASSIALQPDGKIIICGASYHYLIIARFLATGALDVSFGDGLIVKDIQSDYPYPAYVVLRSDGKILTAASSFGLTETNILLSQYNENGSIDISFGSNGLTTIKAHGLVKDLTVSPDNKIFLATDNKSLITKCNSDGTIDSSFGANGEAEIFSIDEHTTNIHNLVLQPDNKILLIGSAELYDPDTYYSFLIARYNNAIVLPIAFKNFTAIKNNDNALLKWQAGSQQNISYFSIQRSNHGNEFEEIGIVNSKGINGSQYYIFTDIHPKEGANYYQIKQVNIDGKATYSSIEKINFNEISNIIIAPNPAQNILIIKGLGNQKNLSIVDVRGNIKSKATSTIDTYTWDISKLPVGVYYLIVEEKGKRISTIKFIK